MYLKISSIIHIILPSTRLLLCKADMTTGTSDVDWWLTRTTASSSIIPSRLSPDSITAKFRLLNSKNICKFDQILQKNLYTVLFVSIGCFHTQVCRFSKQLFIPIEFISTALKSTRGLWVICSPESHSYRDEVWGIINPLLLTCSASKIMKWDNMDTYTISIVFHFKNSYLIKPREHMVWTKFNLHCMKIKLINCTLVLKILKIFPIF